MPHPKAMWNETQLKQTLCDELRGILTYWADKAVDMANGGFVGRIDGRNIAHVGAPKGAVLHARILWTFSAGYGFFGEEKYRKLADRAFLYIRDHFIDADYGGVFWTVNAQGHMLDPKKQIYALAFCIYGLSEYYAVTKKAEALSLALGLYAMIEQYSHDKRDGGYLEAFTRDWAKADDVRLSEKDANEKKTMNTHLHIIEAYANLYKVSPSEGLRRNIAELLGLFDRHFIDRKKFHLRLFFDEQWNEKRNVVSYGHDIEAAWLLQQCAEIIQDQEWIDRCRQYAVKIADAAMEGLDEDGGLWYEYDLVNSEMVAEKHWWPQAEAVAGFFNAWEVTNDARYFDAAMNAWLFINDHIIDWEGGEWFWGVRKDYTVMEDKDKVGVWKCPYHNARACIEVLRRKNTIING